MNTPPEYRSPHRPTSLQDDADVLYFAPGQLLFLVEHDDPLTPDQLIEHLEAHPVIYAHRKRGALAGISFDASRVYSHPAPPPDPTQSTGKSPSRSSISDLVANFGRPRRSERSRALFSTVAAALPLDDEELLRQVDELDDEIIRHQDDNDQPLTLRTASPNWFAGGAPQHVGTGGPGALPVPEDLAPDPAWMTDPVDAPGRPWSFNLPHLTDPRFGRGGGVEVAILDTAPSAQALLRAFENLGQTHPLVRGLLAPNGSLPSDRLRVTYGDSALLSPLNDPANGYALKGHDYVMADHGLFVAGVIHSLAPEANLHLVQVLNDYGVGTLETILAGLAQVLNTWDRRKPLVVNMSFTLSTPLVGHKRPAIKAGRLLTDATFLERMGWPLEWHCESLREHNALLVAAAGNDAEKGYRPSARQPAAFDTVIGVAALKADGSLADYSNLADAPATIGVATFGGDAQPGQGEATLASDNSLVSDKERGSLGVYIGDFPGEDGGAAHLAPATASAKDHDRMHGGWARWSGTSFAAPVISGVLARLRSTVYTDEDALARVYAAQPDLTPNSEEVFTAQQG